MIVVGWRARPYSLWDKKTAVNNDKDIMNPGVKEVEAPTKEACQTALETSYLLLTVSRTSK
jgi:hypothetical protein